MRLSVGEMLAKLEAQIAFHRERTAFHTEQRDRHQAELGRHAAELDRLTRYYETFKGVAADVEEAFRDAQPALASELAKGDDALGGKPRVGRMVARVVKTWEPGVPFGASAVAAEIGRRFAGKLSRGVDVRSVGASLRRRCEEGVLELVREGKPFHEAVYRKPAVG